MHIHTHKHDTDDNDLNKNILYLDDNKEQFIPFTNSFKYLGTVINSSLDDTEDITMKIKNASVAFSALKHRLFSNKNISRNLRLRLYLSIPLNLLLWGCECWAMKESDICKLKWFHRRCLRSILGINMLDTQHERITNEDVINQLNSTSLDSIINLRRSKWVHKIANMNQNRIPRKLIGSWINKKRSNHRPYKTTRESYVNTLKTLGFNSVDGKFQDWMHIAKKGK